MFEQICKTWTELTPQPLIRCRVGTSIQQYPKERQTRAHTHKNNNYYCNSNKTDNPRTNRVTNGYTRCAAVTTLQLVASSIMLINRRTNLLLTEEHAVPKGTDVMGNHIYEWICVYTQVYVGVGRWSLSSVATAVAPPRLFNRLKGGRIPQNQQKFAYSQLHEQ